MHYLLGDKPGDHQYLFDQVIGEMDQDHYRIETHQVASSKETIRTETSYIVDVFLNKTNADVKVHFLQHHEFDCSSGAVTKAFSCLLVELGEVLVGVGE